MVGGGWSKSGMTVHDHLGQTCPHIFVRRQSIIEIPWHRRSTSEDLFRFCCPTTRDLSHKRFQLRDVCLKSNLYFDARHRISAFAWKTEIVWHRDPIVDKMLDFDSLKSYQIILQENKYHSRQPSRIWRAGGQWEVWSIAPHHQAVAYHLINCESLFLADEWR